MQRHYRATTTRSVTKLLENRGITVETADSFEDIAIAFSRSRRDAQIIRLRLPRNLRIFTPRSGLVIRGDDAVRNPERLDGSHVAGAIDTGLDPSNSMDSEMSVTDCEVDTLCV